jgi:hypothetical protein
MLGGLLRVSLPRHECMIRLQTVWEPDLTLTYSGPSPIQSNNSVLIEDPGDWPQPLTLEVGLPEYADLELITLGDVCFRQDIGSTIDCKVKAGLFRVHCRTAVLPSVAATTLAVQASDCQFWQLVAQDCSISVANSLKGGKLAVSSKLVLEAGQVDVSAVMVT